MTKDIDLTDYVNLGARAHIEAHTPYDWDKIPDLNPTGLDKNDVRELVLPVVSAVLEAYVAAHPETDLDWLEGIG